MTDATNNATKPRGKPFGPGNCANPNGRPAGSRNRASIMLDRLAEADARDILQAQIEKAKEGDQQAAALILGRVWPARKGRPVSLDLPAIKTAADVVKAIGRVADAVAAGAITPDEGQAVAAMLEAKRRAIETVELEARVAALEEQRR